jgi:transcriptional regulator with XRE-family HTH domain
MNRAKLSKLVSDKMTELGMTQEQFAEYFSKIAGNQVTYGFVQSLANPRKSSIPEYQNMKGIAKMCGVTLDELDFYLENDDIIDIQEVSKSYKRIAEDVAASIKEAEYAIVNNFSPKEVLRIGLSLVESGVESIDEQIQKAEKITQAFKALNVVDV